MYGYEGGNVMYETTMFAPQGWQCPVCHRVYSPSTPMCYFCGNTNVTNAPNAGTKVDVVYKTMLGDTPETMKQKTTDGGIK